MNVPLHEMETGTLLEGALVSLTREHLLRADETWREEFQRRLSLGMVDEDEPLWRGGFFGGEDESCPEGFVLDAAARVEGLVVFDGFLQPSRKTPGARLLYLRYLAVAPWNRPSASGPGRYPGLDRILLGQAVRESIRLGSPGRVALHVPVSASALYQELGFDVPEAEASRAGMAYCELRPPAAFRLLCELEGPQSLCN